MFVRCVVVALVAAVSLTHCFDRVPGQREWYPICGECRDAELMVAPGIGFDLTHSYGSAMIPLASFF